MKKKIILIVVIAMIGAGGFAAYQKFGKPKETALPVATGMAEVMPIEQVVSIKGLIEGADLAEISSTTNLEVQSILVKEGDRVKKGQTLATLDGKDLQADYNKAVNLMEQSKYQYEAAQTLYAEGAISYEELQRKKVAYENDVINVNTYSKMDQTYIKSPITGTVTRINTSLGRAANDTKDKAPMFVIEDLDNLKMQVKVSEYDITQIKEGQSVEVTAEVLNGQIVNGIVSKIAPTGELKEMNSKEMVIPVTIDVEKDKKNLIAGVSAKAKILIERKESALTVPIDAILQDPETGEAFLFKVVDNKLKKVSVQLGIEGNLSVEIITSEVKAEDMIVLGPTFDLVDDLAVAPMAQ